MVTTEQVRAAGWDKHAVEYRVASGRLFPVVANVFSLGCPARTPVEFWMAAVLSFGPLAVLSHSAAAELYGWLRYSLREIHVITRTKRKPRDGITPHHRRDGVGWRYVDDIPVTTAEQTILDCATCVRSDKAYRRIVRQAQVDGAVTHARLLAFAAMNAGRSGVARMRRELADGPARTRSAFEDEVLELFRCGEQPLQNVILYGEEVDLYFPRSGTVLEVDGSVHDNPTSRADDAAKQARLEGRGLRVLRLR